MVLSNKTIPFLCRPLAYQKYIEKMPTMAIMISWEPTLTQIAVRYRGASLYLIMNAPAIPPNPLQAVPAAAKVALFHCPTILEDWYAFIAAQFETYPPVAKYVPIYRTVS